MRNLLLLLLLLLSIPLSAQEGRGFVRQKKVALVIGNSDYDHAKDLEGKPLNDATDIAAILRGLGFFVLEHSNTSQTKLENAIRDFAAKADRAEIAFVFYAGHGLQKDGINYLVPTDANIFCDYEIPGECVDLPRLMDALKYASTHVNVLVLDACRDNPFADNDCPTDGRNLNSSQKSFSSMVAPSGTFIAFSTSPGKIASNGLKTDRNSPYTAALKTYLRQECLRLTDLFQLVRTDLSKSTDGKQEGWDQNSTIGNFYLKCTNPPDTDGDGITDPNDKCPDQAGPFENEGCPDQDSDGDGIIDRKDRCPEEAGTIKNGGCPEEVTAIPPSGTTNKNRPSDMVLVKGGYFEMGCTAEQGSDCYNDEKPKRRVYVDDFWMSTHEVTFDEYDAYCRATSKTLPNDRGWGRGQRPVINVSWQDAVDYCKWRSKQDSRFNYRLPTEAEWEYAARGGQQAQGTKYAGSNDLDKVGWSSRNSGSKTQPVMTKQPNSLGLYDMSGNVYEWCSDWYGNYSSSSQQNPTGPASGSNRVLRGGSWYSNAGLCRVSNRGINSPDYRSDDVGFRVVSSPVQ